MSEQSPAFSATQPGAVTGVSTTGTQGFQYQVLETRPDTLLRHSISDEELDGLCEMRRDYLWEGIWAAIGAAVGTAQPAFVTLKDAYFTDTPVAISAGDLFQVVLFFLSVAAGVILGLITYKKSGGEGALVTRIRNRTPRLVQ